MRRIAQQCPYEFGEAVYQARMFLAFIDTTTYQNLCESDFDNEGEKSVSNASVNSEKIRVSPNPFENYITIKFEKATNSITEGKIYDVTGRLVIFFEIPAESTIFVVETDKLPNGAFYIKLWNNNGETYFSKILK